MKTSSSSLFFVRFGYRCHQQSVSNLSTFSFFCKMPQLSFLSLADALQFQKNANSFPCGSPHYYYDIQAYYLWQIYWLIAFDTLSADAIAFLFILSGRFGNSKRMLTASPGVVPIATMISKHTILADRLASLHLVVLGLNTEVCSEWRTCGFNPHNSSQLPSYWCYFSYHPSICGFKV